MNFRTINYKGPQNNHSINDVDDDHNDRPC